MQFCRIAWTNTLNGLVGYGEWYPISKKQFLKEWLEQLATTSPYIIHELQIVTTDNIKDNIQITNKALANE